MADENFLEVEELIRKNPGQANAQAFEWERFLKSNPESSSEIISIKTEEEFRKWVENHPEKHIDPSVWEGKEISEYYLRHPKQPQENAPQESEIKEVSKQIEEESPQKPETGYAYVPQQLPAEESQPAETISPVSSGKQIQQPPSASRPSGGGISRGINNINNFARRGLTNPFGKIGQRVATQTALRGLAAFLASSSGVWVPIAITLVLVFIFTFIIVGFGGAPALETGVQQATPTATPTQAPIETPAP